MCICFTLSQQDNYKCCLYCSSRLGNVLVTVKATKHMSSRLCADTWLAEYMQEPESGKFFSWRWWMLFCPHRIGNGTYLGLNLTLSCSWKHTEWHVHFPNFPTTRYACGHSENINCVEVPSSSCLRVLVDSKSSDGSQHLGQTLSGTWASSSFCIPELGWGWDSCGGKLKDWISALQSWRRWSPLDHKSISCTYLPKTH